MKLLPFLFIIFLQANFLLFALPSGIIGKSETQHMITKATSIENELITDGLYFAEFYDYIYRGHFENVEIPVEDQLLLMIFSKYLRTFGTQCSQYLPENTVEIMDWYCNKEEVTTENGFEVSRICVGYDQRGSTIFADPNLYEAQLELERNQSAQVIFSTMKIMSDPNAIGNSIDLLHKTRGLMNDMNSFFRINPCNSEAVKRFESNLRNYSLKLTPDRLDAISKYAVMKESGGPTGSQNLTKLLDDLVIDQSQTWAFNQYLKGSISSLVIQSKDNLGRPIQIRANYNYSGFMGKSQGWLQVVFKNGLPDCIYFYDFPQNCKSPNSGIVANFSEGKYSY